MVAPADTWSPASWRAYPAQQQPDWPDEAGLAAATERLKQLPPLVFAGEARDLTAALAGVAEGRAFLLQAGDCAESFADFSAITIREKLKIILQMAAVMTYAGTLPVIKLGRIAGQFAKPRSAPTETIDGVELPAFRGHMVHDDAPTAAARVPDADRMVQAYHQSAATLNLLRAFTKGGFADLTRVHSWNQEFVATSPEGRRYEAIATEIERALRVHGRVRDRPHVGAAAARGRRVDEPRGPAPRLRGGAHPARLAHRRVVRLLGPHALGRRPHAPGRRRARRVLRGRPKPARPQGRPDGDRRRARRHRASASTRTGRRAA